MFHYQTGRNAGGIGDTEATRNQVAMQGRKCSTCELGCKEAERKDRNSNTLMDRKHFIEKFYCRKCPKLQPEIVKQT